MHRVIIFGVWIITRILILLQINALPAVEGDIQLYYIYGGNILHGLVPYLDFTMEYPPGVIPFFVLANFMAAVLGSFRLFFMFEIMVFDLLGLVLVDKFGRRYGYSERFWFLTMMFYLALPAVMSLIAYQRYDLIPAILVLLAVWLHDRGWSGWAGAVLGFAFAVKLYPLILTPIFLLAAYKRQSFRRDLLYGLPAFAAGAAVAWLPAMMAAGEEFWVFLSYHSQRGLQIESFYAPLVMIGHWFGLPVSSSLSFGSWNLVSEISPLLAKGSMWVMLVLMGLVLLQAVREVKVQESADPHYLLRFSALMVMAFVIGGKVFSPQYLLWIVPMFILALGEESLNWKWIWFLFGLLTLLTYVVFPINYYYLIHFGVKTWIVLILRNALLAVVFYNFLRKRKNQYNIKKITSPTKRTCKKQW